MYCKKGGSLVVAATAADGTTRFYAHRECIKEQEADITRSMKQAALALFGGGVAGFILYILTH